MDNPSPLRLSHLPFSLYRESHKNEGRMSINPELHEGVVPYLVSPYENFFFLIQRVKLTVESGRCVT